MTEARRIELEARRKALRARIALAATMGKVVRHYDAAVFTNVKGAA
jgi:hypothetical protein